MASFLCIAHRGDQDQAAENTLEAFEAAVAGGFAHFEFDVGLTKDGVAVVIHDDTVDRTAADGVTGAVAELTLAELQAVPLVGGSRVPTLEALLKRFLGRAHLHLELKSAQPELPTTVFELLRATGWLDQPDRGMTVAPGLTITSFILEHLQASVPLYSPGVRHMWLVREATAEVV